MQEISLFHESFNLKKLSTYTLSLLLDKFGLTYVISDTIRNQFVAVRRFNFEDLTLPLIENLQAAIVKDVYLNKHYKEVLFYLAHKKYSLVPAEFFEKKHAVDFLKYNHIIDANDEALFTKFNEDIYEVFAFPNTLVNFIVNHFPEARLYHSTYPFFKIIDAQTDENQNIAAVNFYQNSFDIIIFKDGIFTLLNTFEFVTGDDAVYFILSVLKKINFDVKKTKLLLQGDITSDNKIYTDLQVFINDVSFNTTFAKGFEFSGVNSYQFENLLITDI